MTGPSLIAAAAAAAMMAAWLVQQRTRNAGVVDVAWAFGMMGSGAYYAFTGAGPAWLRVALAALTVVWFLRLGLHIAARTRRERGEDGRYRAMRLWMGPWAATGFFVFFQLQGLFVVGLSLPFLAVADTPEPLPWAVAAGVAVAIAAFIGELSADRQLERFRSEPSNKGLTCRSGLWRYSRHPNYFFEWLHWFAYPLMGWGGPYGGWLWLAPVVMLAFLTLFTGIPYSERQALRSRGDDYREYQRQTSAFFPWIPLSRT